MQHCQMCASCCTSNIPVTADEIAKLKVLVAERKIIPRPKISDEAHKDVCPFLGSELKCTIYDNRPAICQAFYCTQTLDKTGSDFRKNIVKTGGIAKAESTLKTVDVDSNIRTLIFGSL